MQKKRLNILMADDDPDDQVMVKEAMQDLGGVKSFHAVHDGPGADRLSVFAGERIQTRQTIPSRT